MTQNQYHIYSLDFLSQIDLYAPLYTHDIVLSGYVKFMPIKRRLHTFATKLHVIDIYSIIALIFHVFITTSLLFKWFPFCHTSQPLKRTKSAIKEAILAMTF